MNEPNELKLNPLHILPHWATHLIPMNDDNDGDGWIFGSQHHSVTLSLVINDKRGKRWVWFAILVIFEKSKIEIAADQKKKKKIEIAQNPFHSCSIEQLSKLRL